METKNPVSRSETGCGVEVDFLWVRLPRWIGGTTFLSPTGLSRLAGMYSVANYDLYMTQAKLIFIFINHKLIIKHAIECIVLN
jgi:hypothetical protein